MGFDDPDACEPSVFIDGVFQQTILRFSLLRVFINIYDHLWWPFNFLVGWGDKYVMDLSVL